MGSRMDNMLDFNQKFVAAKEYERYYTDKLPDKKMAILACMDTRLVELLPAALGFKNGDVKLIKNAGALVSHPFGSTMRSLMVCIYELGVEEIAVIGHTDCGMSGFDITAIEEKMEERGIPCDRIAKIKSLGLDLDSWLKGFDDPYDAIRKSVSIIREHPLVPKDVLVQGFLMDPRTGAISVVSD